VRKKGSQFWRTSRHASARRDRKSRGFSEITHDVTERKRAEEDLDSYADPLKNSRRLVEVRRRNAGSCKRGCTTGSDRISPRSG